MRPKLIFNFQLAINEDFQLSIFNYQFSILNFQFSINEDFQFSINEMDKKTIWKTIIQTLVTILTAIGTTLGVTSCMGL